MIGKCSFCGLEKEVVAGAYGTICSDCCNTVIDEFDIKTDDSCGSNINLKPHELKALMDEYIVGQEEAKKIFADYKLVYEF